MKSREQTAKDGTSVRTPEDDAAPKAAEPSETERELTDDELAAVAGGTKIVSRPPGAVVTG
jgi:hypothetical protein